MFRRHYKPRWCYEYYNILKNKVKRLITLISGLELDSGSSVGGSLPSPGAASCSLDAASTSTSPSCALMEHAPSPVATVSSASVNTVQPTGPVGEPPLSQRVGVLQQRVSTRDWSRQKHTFLFTNSNTAKIICMALLLNPESSLVFPFLCLFFSSLALYLAERKIKTAQVVVRTNPLQTIYFNFLCLTWPERLNIAI